MASYRNPPVPIAAKLEIATFFDEGIMAITFRNPPQPALLRQLANGSLEQSQNLIRALRLWVLLSWLYSDKGDSALPRVFTYADWRTAFFGDDYQDETQAELLDCQNLHRAGLRTTEEWLSEFKYSVDDWRSALQKYLVSEAVLEVVLKERLFAQVRKSLQKDFDLLVKRNWLRQELDVGGRSKLYSRIEVFPPHFQVSESDSLASSLPLKERAYAASALGRFMFLDPRFPVLAEQLEPAEFNEDNNRVFLHIDYVVPESSPLQDSVDSIQSELQEMWDSNQNHPLLFTYRSAHQNLNKECVVYPVCIYFMEYAKYLCAFGNTPKDDINWYKYRLDRILSQRMEPLDWQHPRVPQLLREQYTANRLPTPTTVNGMLKQAWGCDFYKAIGLMVLRFDRAFHQSYLQGISIHPTGLEISYDRATSLIKQQNSDPGARQTSLEIIQSRPTTDIYYQVQYRVTDYYVVRWLRALGANVEVLLPWSLRTEMAREIQRQSHLYRIG